MTTKFRAQFDGKALIPLEPVEIPTGQVLEVEAHETPAADPDVRRGSPEAILRAMREPPHLTREDVAELERVIEESRLRSKTAASSTAGPTKRGFSTRYECVQ